MRLAPFSLFLLATSIAVPAFAQTEIKTNCFCQAGNNSKQFSAEIELTDANRVAVRKMIEAGDLDLRKIIRISGSGCMPADWRKNRLCGQTSVTTTKPDGKRESERFDNTPVTGTKTIRISYTGNIPRKQGTPPKPIVLDDERWAKTQVLIVGGLEE